MPTFSEKELEQQLAAAGKSLVKPPRSRDELLPLLDQIEALLSKVEQAPAKSMQNAFSPVMKALVMKDLFKHSDVDVKVGVASCISELIRITAPDAPYDDDKMQDVFQLIVSSLENLSDISSRSYDKSATILKTVAKVNSCVIMVDLECDQMIIEMFQHFLKAIREDHADNIFTSMETIMTVVLKESDFISTELLAPILTTLKRNDESAMPITKKLAERVLQNSADKLRPYLRQAVKFLDTSLDDYTEVVSCVCGENAHTVGLSIERILSDQPDIVTSRKSPLKSTKNEGTQEETPKMSNKRKQTPAKEKVASETLEYDENLVGSKVKVWWSKDGMFFEGIITSFDSAKKMHKVSYTDGDEEVLNLKKERWEFDMVSNGDQEVEHDTSSDMKRKKKGNANSETSSKRQKVEGSSRKSKPKDTAPKSKNDGKAESESKDGKKSEDVSVKSKDQPQKLGAKGQVGTGKESKDEVAKVSKQDSQRSSKSKERTPQSGKIPQSTRVTKSDSSKVKEIDLVKEKTGEVVSKKDVGCASDSEARSMNQTEKTVDASNKTEKEDGKKSGRAKPTSEKESSAREDHGKDIVTSRKSPLKSTKNEDTQEETPKMSNKRKQTPADEKMENQGKGIIGIQQNATSGKNTTKSGSKTNQVAEVLSSAKWDVYLNRMFIRSCVEEIRKGNRPNGHFNNNGWDNLIKRFNQLTGKNFAHKQIRNHWDAMKKEWILFKKLMHNSTGIGWDPLKNSLDASNEWWDSKIKENACYKNFRNKDLSLIWFEYDRLFSNIATTGERARARSQRSGNEDTENEIIIEIDGEAKEVEDHVEIDDSYDIGVVGLAEHNTSFETHETSIADKIMFPCVSSIKIKYCGEDSKRKKVSGAASLKEDIHSLLQFMENKNSATSAPSTETTIKDAMEILNNVPGIAPTSELWNYACNLVSNKDMREVFANQPSHESRLSWLEFNYDQFKENE